MKTIFIGSTPNLEQEDLALTRELLQKPNVPKDIRQEVTNQFKKTFGFEDIFFTNTGRASLYLILKTIGIKEGDEVITQSFSCMAASQPILWVGAKPVFADIERGSFNIDIEDVKKKITDKTRVVIVQHLFGQPKDIKEEIKKLNENRSEENKIFLIEDCAHAIGAKIGNNYAGTLGDFSYFSFSQDKVLSCIQGGAVTTNRLEYIQELKDNYQLLKQLPESEVQYLLKYRLAWDTIKNTYAFPSIKFKVSLGRILIPVLRKLKRIKPQVNVNKAKEIEAFKMSDTQLVLLRLQFRKLHKLNTHRKMIAEIYNKELNKDLKYENKGIYLRYPVLVQNPEEVRVQLRNIKVIIGNWYNHPIYPKGVNMDEFGYMNDCHTAERKSKYIINLPTNISVSEGRAREIVKVVNKCAEAVNF